MKEIIKKLISFGTRQDTQAYRAYTYISKLLAEKNIPFATETYEVDLPNWKKATLTADNTKIPCLPTGLTSGTITNGYAIISSLISSRYFLETPHINFNPRCTTISRANFSKAPSIAVSRNSLATIFKARKVNAKITVTKKKTNTYQILVGNKKNPKTILFSHFDSIGTGAVDNATGTALMLDKIIKEPTTLENNLFVFDGNEELSYDFPTYWGKGYRNFEQKYARQLHTANKNVVVDCIGYAPTEIYSAKNAASIINLAFPIKNIADLATKTYLITSDYDSLMNVYHSDKDNGRNIKEPFLRQAYERLNDYLY